MEKEGEEEGEQGEEGKNGGKGRRRREMESEGKWIRERGEDRGRGDREQI